MYTQALNSGGGVAQRLNYPFSFLPPLVGGEAPGPLATRWGGKNISGIFW
jgi:hypothetical protein